MHPNAAIASRGYEAFASGDFETLNELIADDIVWHSANGSLSGDYTGKEAVFAYLGRIGQESAGTLRQDIHDIVANDDHAVALVRTSAQRNGASLDVAGTHVMHIRDGQMTEFWSYSDDTAATNEFWS